MTSPSGGADPVPHVTVWTRSYFSTYQLWGAENCAATAAEIEAAYSGRETRFEVEHRANVLGAITMSVGFVEALVNELFADAADATDLDRHPGADAHIAQLSPRNRDLMATWWELTDDGRERLLQKCQLLLLFADRPRLDTSGQPYQDAALLVRLRNAIVHFRPESVSVANDPHRLERKLQGKFTDNPLTSVGNAWWPDHALGAGCATWACGTARALADEVVAGLGITVNYQPLQHAWWPVEQHRAQTGPSAPH